MSISPATFLDSSANSMPPRCSSGSARHTTLPAPSQAANTTRVSYFAVHAAIWADGSATSKHMRAGYSNCAWV